MQYLFNFLYVLPALIYAPVFFFKSRRAGENPRLLFSERWGRIASEKLEKLRDKRVIWVHAVSVGEVKVAQRWIDAMREAQVPFHFVLTTVTPTGQKIARQSEADDLTAIYVPFDFSFCVEAFLKAVNPEALVLVETEIWPNLILLSARREIPVFLINARLSEKSLRGYWPVSALLQPVFAGITRIFAQDEADIRRFRQLGIPESKIEMAGNVKFDTETAQKISEPLRREEMGLDAKVKIWIAGSTHPGEEKKILEVFSLLHSAHPRLRLILAPRHVERAAEIFNECKNKKFKTQLFSQAKEMGASYGLWDVLIVDQIGVLKSVYALGEFVFMGGSWIQHGGQNPIEPAVFNLPVLHGPHTFNFKQIYEVLDQEEAAFCVESGEACFRKMEFFLNHPEAAIAAGRLAGEVVSRYRGASALQAIRVIESLNEFNERTSVL